MSASLLFFFFFFFLLLVVPASADLTDIVKTCRHVSCDPSPEYQGINYDTGRQLQWLAAGLPQIFWEAALSGSLLNETSVSSDCRRQLDRISGAMLQNQEWAFHFPDSSGKTPPALLRSTTSSYGDYDQCLDIEHEGIKGMYCMMDVFPLRTSVAKGKLDMHKVSVLDGFPHFVSLCLPSACTANEAQEAAKILLKPFNMKVAGDIHCDTRSSNSWLYRLSHLTSAQQLSLFFIASLVVAVCFGTLYDLYKRSSSSSDEPFDDSLLTSLSVMHSSRQLFYAKPWSFETLVFDCLKTNIIFLGVLAHVLTDAESPLSLATIAQQKVWHAINQPLLQNDSGLLAIPFLSGIATFALLNPLAKGKKLAYLTAIIERVSRFLPPLIVLTACEFIWPILGSGPLYSRVARFNLIKCERNWIYNMFFVNNFISAFDICGGSSFSSSVDMHLFLLGLIVIFIFSRSERVGVWLTWLMIIFGTGKVAYNAAVYDTGFSVLDLQLSAYKMREYFDRIHLATASYIAPYFAGILVTYLRSKGQLTPDLSGPWRKTRFGLLTWCALLAVNINCACVTLYPYSLKWFFISFNRTFQLIGNVMVFIFWMSFRDYWEEKWGKEMKGQGVTFSPFKAFCRLCFPLYICNYLYVRMEFYSRRFLVSGSSFWMFKRATSSLIIVYLFTIVFHLFLLAPLDAIREKIMKSKRKSDSK